MTNIKHKRSIWIWLVSIIFVLTIIVAVMPGYTPPLNNKNHNSIAELRRIRLGEADQWIIIRGEDTSLPILLFIHGGPGTSQLTLLRRKTRELEKHFVVVDWDQRGAGKSYSAIADTSRMHIEQFVSDIHDLTLYLRNRFHQDKIILAGHSWGSALSVLTVAKYPELYRAYIGIGQTSDMQRSEAVSYEWTLQQAIRAGDTKAIRKLKEIGHPPYQGDWRKKFMTERMMLGQYGGEYWNSKSGAFGPVIYNLLTSPEYTFWDKCNFFRGIFGSVRLLFPELLKVNLFKQAPELKVPVWFMEGRHDYEVPAVLAAQYFQAIKAPMKKLVWFENSSHMPNTEESEKFNNVLIEQVLPSIQDYEAKTGAGSK